ITLSIDLRTVCASNSREKTDEINKRKKKSECSEKKNKKKSEEKTVFSVISYSYMTQHRSEKRERREH
ncbi:hypothetical protein, partial [Microbacterium sp. KNMS]